jgi:glutamate-ammonia-ligase adenylyltransferase
VLLDELIDPARLYALPERRQLAADLQQHMLRIPLGMILEAQMEALRYFKLAHRLRVRGLRGERRAAPDEGQRLPELSRRDHARAGAAVAWHYLVEFVTVRRRKRTACPATPGFIVVAYGKLGGIELGLRLGSRPGLRARCRSGDSRKPTAPRRSRTACSSPVWGSGSSACSRPTRLGQLYEVDMRLRPSGAAGLLVSSSRRSPNTSPPGLDLGAPGAGAGAGRRGLSAARTGERFEELRREVLASSRVILPRCAGGDRDARQDARHLLNPKPAAVKVRVSISSKGRRYRRYRIYGAILRAGLVANRYPALSVYTDNIRSSRH